MTDLRQAKHPVRISKNKLSNRSFIIHLGQYQILPKEMIDKRHIASQQTPRYITDQWVMPGGKTMNLNEIIQMAANQGKAITIEEISATH